MREEIGNSFMKQQDISSGPAALLGLRPTESFPDPFGANLLSLQGCDQRCLRSHVCHE